MNVVRSPSILMLKTHWQETILKDIPLMVSGIEGGTRASFFREKHLMFLWGVHGNTPCTAPGLVDDS